MDLRNTFGHRGRDMIDIGRVLAGERDVDILRDGMVTPGQLAYAKRAARARGIALPAGRPKRANEVRVGSLRDALVGLTEAEMKWLLRNMPRGVTVAEFCVALIRDAVVE